MYQGRTIQELGVEIERQRETSRDFIADTRHMQVSTTEQGTALELQGIDAPPFVMGDRAHEQISERFKIPRKHYDRLRTDHPDVFDHEINTLFQREPARRMVRTLDGKARAIMSHKYRPIDNWMIAEAALPPLYEQPDMRVDSAEVTDRRLYIKAVLPKIEREIKVGDVVQAGIIVRNSEVGLGAIDIADFLFRLACLNGMISAIAGFRKAHLGRAIEGDGDGASEFYQSDTMKADDKALILKMRDAVRACLASSTFEKSTDKLIASTTDRIERDPVVAVEQVQKRYSLTEEERGSVLRHLIEGADMSRYGMVQAVTRASQDAASYDRATDLEVVGGQVLELSKDDWSVISEN
jgi:hypothetical protein|tara:strand:+ start:486 stop:1544 length:1059 start_codon:yes stop_codon:yes gene_type:complete